MKHACLLTALLALPLATPAPQTRAGTRLALCPNPLPREPLVIYEVTGGTLTGPIDYALVVNDDGSARLSSSLGGGGTGSAQLTYVDPALAAALRQDLEAAGALSACDQADNVSDTPLQTLTVFRPGSRRANTFSWFTAEGELAEVQPLLDAFIAAHFAPLPGGGGS